MDAHRDRCLCQGGRLLTGGNCISAPALCSLPTACSWNNEVRHRASDSQPDVTESPGSIWPCPEALLDAVTKKGGMLVTQDHAQENPTRKNYLTANSAKVEKPRSGDESFTGKTIAFSRTHINLVLFLMMVYIQFHFSFQCTASWPDCHLLYKVIPP